MVPRKSTTPEVEPAFPRVKAAWSPTYYTSFWVWLHAVSRARGPSGGCSGCSSVSRKEETFGCTGSEEAPSFRECMLNAFGLWAG